MMNEKGMTLVEVLVTIAVGTISLMSVLSVGAQSVRAYTKLKQDQSILNEIKFVEQFIHESIQLSEMVCVIALSSDGREIDVSHKEHRVGQEAEVKDGIYNVKRIIFDKNGIDQNGKSLEKTLEIRQEQMIDRIKIKLVYQSQLLSDLPTTFQVESIGDKLFLNIQMKDMYDNLHQRFINMTLKHKEAKIGQWKGVS
ncbi:MAG: PilW family protein [Cellulosilyticaceae bacterium]